MKGKFLLLALLFLAACAKDPVIVYEPTHHWVDKTVAVVYPMRDQIHKTRMERTADWFLTNFQQAQLFGKNGVRLHLEWYDEFTADANALSEKLAADTSVVAIIGPFTSGPLEAFAEACHHTEKPLVAPTVTSEEIIRRFAVSTRTGRKEEFPFLWSLTETDVALLEIALATYATRIQHMFDGSNKASCSVLAPSNAYGKTFSDWAPFEAENMDVDILENAQYSGDDDFLRNMERMLDKGEYLNVEFETECILSVVENFPLVVNTARFRRNYYVMKAMGITEDQLPQVDYYGNDDYYNSFTVMADAIRPAWFCFGAFSQEDLDALDPAVRRDLHCTQGFTPYADPTTGFELSYEYRFGVKPTFEEVKFYDALMLVAFACYTLQDAPSGNRRFNEAIYDLTFPNGSESMGASVWSATAMELFLSSLGSGAPVKFRGAGGNISFDPETCTPATGTTYIHWRILDGKLRILNYFTSGGSNRTSSATVAWNYVYDEVAELRRLREQAQDVDDEKWVYAPLEDQYAVLVHGSIGFSNYRHLADVLSVYQHLRQSGFDDDHIILIADRSPADSKSNPEPGVVRTSLEGPDLLRNVHIDYDASQLTPEDIAAILMGQRSERLPVVLPQGAGNNVFLYWSGHGHCEEMDGADEFVWRDQPVAAGFTGTLLEETVRQMQMRKLFIVAEPCYAEAVVKAIEGIPGVLAMTGAKAQEQSWADNWNKEGNFWMCDRFTSNFVNALTSQPDITYKDLFLYCAQHTLGSHARLVNAAHFGNLYHSGPAEFINRI